MRLTLCTPDFLSFLPYFFRKWGTPAPLICPTFCSRTGICILQSCYLHSSEVRSKGREMNKYITLWIYALKALSHFSFSLYFFCQTWKFIHHAPQSTKKPNTVTQFSLYWEWQNNSFTFVVVWSLKKRWSTSENRYASSSHMKVMVVITPSTRSICYYF